MIVFSICNHCLYVKAVIGRDVVADARVLLGRGTGFAAICSNDASSYPAITLPEDGRIRQAPRFRVSYLHDGASTLPAPRRRGLHLDFFGFDRDLKLKYRGCLDEGRTTPPPPGARRELVQAMRAAAATGRRAGAQIPSIGCSIKWRTASG